VQRALGGFLFSAAWDELHSSYNNLYAIFILKLCNRHSFDWSKASVSCIWQGNGLKPQLFESHLLRFLMSF